MFNMKYNSIGDAMLFNGIPTMIFIFIFQDNMTFSIWFIILDYPDSLNPTVEVYSLSGNLIKRFSSQDISDGKIAWNGKNEAGHDIAAGLYFILVKDNGFRKIGKIARQR